VAPQTAIDQTEDDKRFERRASRRGPGQAPGLRHGRRGEDERPHRQGRDPHAAATARFVIPLTRCAR
ncbi:MAG: hypothetical protein ACK56I_16810, partial [bacterium]